MLRTLYAKLSVALVAIVLAIGVLYAVFALVTTRHYLEAAEQRLNRDLARDLVADRNLVEEGRINEPALKDLFHDYMVVNPSIEIYLLDLEGRILSFSADPGAVKRKYVSLGPVRAFLAGEDDYPLLGDDPRSHDGQKAFSVTEVPNEQSPDGYLYVVLLGERVDSIAALLDTSHIVRYSGFALLVSLGVGALAGLVVLRAMTRRLRRFTGHIDQFRAGDFRASEPFETSVPGDGDEIAQLGRAYDEMAARIREQIEALERTDALRREMVAHVSHDLRTPLATLHGYIETLKLKDATLSPAERERYLAVALDQSERLRRLVGDLFELAKLDAREQTPECEPVALAELVSDVAQKFRLEAERPRLHHRRRRGRGPADGRGGHRPGGARARKPDRQRPLPFPGRRGCPHPHRPRRGRGAGDGLRQRTGHRPRAPPPRVRPFLPGRERTPGQRPRRARPRDREAHRGVARRPARSGEHPGPRHRLQLPAPRPRAGRTGRQLTGGPPHDPERFASGAPPLPPVAVLPVRRIGIEPNPTRQSRNQTGWRKILRRFVEDFTGKRLLHSPTGPPGDRIRRTERLRLRGTRRVAVSGPVTRGDADA